MHRIESKVDQISLNETEHLVTDASQQKPPTSSRAETMFESVLFKFQTSLVTFTYMGVKFLYLFVAVLQILIMNAYLSTQANEYYGSEVFSNIISGTNEINNTDSKIFPR